MNEDHEVGQNKSQPIPEEFYSFAEGKPFDHCINCNGELIQSGSSYFIEKSIRKYSGYQAQDVIFEYAICFKCAHQFQEKMSEESMQKITQYMGSKLNFEKLSQQQLESQSDIKKGFDKCLITGETVDEAEEYQIFAYCEGENIRQGSVPYMISGTAMEEISELLSAKTRDELDGFMDDHFGLPPELREKVSGKNLIWI